MNPSSFAKKCSSVAVSTILRPPPVQGLISALGANSALANSPVPSRDGSHLLCGEMLEIILLQDGGQPLRQVRRQGRAKPGGPVSPALRACYETQVRPGPTWPGLLLGTGPARPAALGLLRLGACRKSPTTGLLALVLNGHGSTINRASRRP